MCTNDKAARDDVSTLQTRLVILEAALAWIRHESRAATADAERRTQAMARIAALASQVLDDDDELALLRLRRRIASEVAAAQRSAS